MARDYLALCQAVAQECGIGQNTPAKVTDQVGMLQKIVTWTNEAWHQIQTEHPDWSFLWRENTITIEPQLHYSADELGMVGCGRVMSLRTEKRLLELVGHKDADKVGYSPFNPAEGEPRYCIERYDGRYILHPQPLEPLLLNSEFYLKPESLSNNEQVPMLPDDEPFDYAIVYLAVQAFALDQQDQALLTRATDRYLTWMSALECKCLPKLSIGFGAAWH